MVPEPLTEVPATRVAARSSERRAPIRVLPPEVSVRISIEDATPMGWSGTWGCPVWQWASPILAPWPRQTFFRKSSG